MSKSSLRLHGLRTGPNAMPFESDTKPMLPFNALPQPTPPQKLTTRPQIRKPSKIKQLIDKGDWKAYEENVLETVRQAIEKYRQLYTDSVTEKVFQVSIWTDPQTQTTAVNFETREHATAHTAKWAQIWREKYQDEETATRLEKEGYNGNPADFKHREFLTHKHPEIEAIDQLNYYYTTHRYAADARISASLRKVVQQIRKQNVLDGLPREEEVWIGVNSPRDWYDHVVKV